MYGDEAGEYLHDEVKLALHHFDEKVQLQEERFARKVDTETERQSQLLEIRVQRFLENRGLESLNEIDRDINNAILAEVPKVVSQIQNNFSQNPKHF